MLFTKPTDSPEPYCIVTLSDDREIYEANRIQFWRELKKFCTSCGLCVKKLYIVVGNQSTPINRNHIKQYFIIRNGKFTVRGGKVEIKKGYGVVCNHPGGIVRTYIAWYNDDTGKFVYNEVIRGTNKLYTEELGIAAV